jgi:type I restriction enzyme S subunit
MESKQVLVPRLRFGGFDKEHRSCVISDFATVSSGGTPSRSKPNYWGGNIPWITTSQIDFNTIFEAKQFITDEGLTNSSAKLFPKGSLLLALYGQGKTRAKVAILGIDATTNQACASIQINITTASTSYIFYDLQRRYESIRNLSNDGGQKNLSGALVKVLRVKLPSLPEQEKIAAFLTSVDDRIDQLKRKKSLLQDYKKGAMQKLFSQELRFKDEQGKDFPDWEEKKLGDAIESTVSGASLKPSDFCFNGNHPVFPKKYISSGGKLSDNAETTYCTDEFFAINPSSTIDSSYLITTLRDLVPSGPSIGYIVSYDSGIIYMLAQGVYGLKIVEWVSNRGFLIQYSNTQIFRKWMRKIKVGSTQVHIRTNEYKAVPFRRPSLPEQTKIANFLSSLDQKLEQIDTQITQTQSFKKGLLQQMFV